MCSVFEVKSTYIDTQLLLFILLRYTLKNPKDVRKSTILNHNFKYLPHILDTLHILLKVRKLYRFFIQFCVNNFEMSRVQNQNFDNDVFVIKKKKLLNTYTFANQLFFCSSQFQTQFMFLFITTYVLRNQKQVFRQCAFVHQFDSSCCPTKIQFRVLSNCKLLGSK